MSFDWLDRTNVEDVHRIAWKLQQKDVTYAQYHVEVRQEHILLLQSSLQMWYAGGDLAADGALTKGSIGLHIKSHLSQDSPNVVFSPLIIAAAVKCSRPTI